VPGPDDWFADPYAVQRDDEVVEDILSGTRPMPGPVEKQLAGWHDNVRQAPLPHVSGWIEDPSEPSGWRWVENLAEMPPGTSHTVGPPQPYPTPWTSGPETPDLVDVPERIDGWCENRPPHELSDVDGID
jgi:hypothetical protein